MTNPSAASSAAAPKAHAGEPFQIPSLDGIRALSFLTVFLAHGGLEKYVPGYFGLTLFFFLSGYLITTLMRMEFTKTGHVSLGQFYLRRVLRIFPPFYLVLIAATALTAKGLLDSRHADGTVTSTPLDWSAVGAQAAHFTNYYIVEHGWWNGMAPGTWVYWSLAVEEHFYLVFPLLFLLLRKRLQRWDQLALALLGLCALLLLWRFALVFALGATKDRMYVSSDTRVDSILFGCILAVWNNPVLDDPKRLTDRTVLLWLLGGLGLLALSLLVRQHAPPGLAPGAPFPARAVWFEQTLRYTLQGLGLLPLFLASIRWHDRWPFKVLSLWPLRRIGLLSYSLYLLHTCALWACEQWVRWPTAARTALVLATILVVAELMYRFVERPFGQVRKRLSAYLR
jgi:peptidoglycan/LPS O-acetylase OafA/YrhL